MVGYWGMDRDANFLLSSLLVKDPPSWSQLETRSDVLIANWMHDCREAAVDELEVLAASSSAASSAFNGGAAITVDNTEVAQRLLYLFQKDLLASPHVGGAILEQKSLRDALFQNDLLFPSFVHKCLSVEWTAATRYSLLALYLLMTGAMMAYWIAFSLKRSQLVQRAWTQSFLLGLLLDFLVVSPIETVCMHIALPATIMADMHKVQEEALLYSKSFRDELPTVQQHHHQHHQHHDEANLGGMELNSSNNNLPRPRTASSSSSSEQHQQHQEKEDEDGQSSSSLWLNTIAANKDKDKDRNDEVYNVSSPGDVDDHGDKGSRSHHHSATSYLFVSHRLSNHFSDALVEARFVRSFKLVLPPGTMFEPSSWKRPVNRLLLQQTPSPSLLSSLLGRRGMSSSSYALTRTAYQHPSVFGSSLLVGTCWRVSVENFVGSSLFVQDVTLQLVVTSIVYLIVVVHVALYYYDDDEDGNDGYGSLLPVPPVAIPSLFVALISMIAFAARALSTSSCSSVMPFQSRDQAAAASSPSSSPRHRHLEGHQFLGGPHPPVASRKVLLLSKLSNKVGPPVIPAAAAAAGLAMSSRYDRDILDEIPGFDEDEDDDDWLEESYEDPDSNEYTSLSSNEEEGEGGRLLTFRDDVSESSAGDSSPCIKAFETDFDADNDDDDDDNDDANTAADNAALPKGEGRSLLGLIWKKTFRSNCDALPPTARESATSAASAAAVGEWGDFYNNRNPSSGAAAAATDLFLSFAAADSIAPDDKYGRLAAEASLGDPSTTMGGLFAGEEEELDIQYFEEDEDDGISSVSSDSGRTVAMSSDSGDSNSSIVRPNPCSSDDIRSIANMPMENTNTAMKSSRNDMGLMKIDELISDEGLMKINELTSDEGLMKIDELTSDEGLILRNIRGGRMDGSVSLSGKLAVSLMLHIDTEVGVPRPASSSVSTEWPLPLPSSDALDPTSKSDRMSSSLLPTSSASSQPPPTPIHSGVRLPPLSMRAGNTPLSMRAGNTPLTTRRTATSDRMTPYIPLDFKGHVQDHSSSSSAVSHAPIKSADAIATIIPQHAPMIVTAGTDVFRIPESPMAAFSTHRRPIPNRRGYRDIQAQCISEADTTSRSGSSSRHDSRQRSSPSPSSSRGNPSSLLLFHRGNGTPSGNDRVRTTASLHGTGLASIPIATSRTAAARGQSRAGSRHGRSEASTAAAVTSTTGDTNGDGDEDTARSISRRRGCTHDIG